MAQLHDYIDMSKYPNLAPEHKDVLRELMHGATDKTAPLWFQAHCEVLFALLESGCERVEEIIQQAQMSGLRNLEFDEDEIGRYDD